MYQEVGASGCLSKDAKGAKLLSDLLRIYTRVFRMGLCEE